MITPTNDYEERVPVKFIKMVQNRLRDTRKPSHNENLLLDSGFMFGVTIKYSPSTIPLEQIAVPDNLRCSKLIKSI